MSNVIVERKFSELNKTKTDKRTNIDAYEIIVGLMRIKVWRKANSFIPPLDEIRKNIASSTTFKLDPSSPVLTGLKLLVRKVKTLMIIYSQIIERRNVF